MGTAGLMTLPDERSRASIDGLTEREIQTLALIANGLSNKRIARDLGISDATVKVYVRNLLRKFCLNSRLELAAWVHRNDTRLDRRSLSPVATLDSAVELPASLARQSDLPLGGTPLGGIPLGGLLDELPGLIYRGDNNPRWSMQFVSAGCLQLTGYPAEYLTRASEHSYGSLILAEYADYIWYCVQCALLQHEPYQLSYRIRCSDGQIKDVWEKGVGVYSADGEVLGVEGAIFEVQG
jgi:DNA-binding CsgD family transcriptional regulator